MQLVVSKLPNGQTAGTGNNNKANARLSNGSLAGMADLTGNTPTTVPSTKSENIVNERLALTAEYHKKRPVSKTLPKTVPNTIPPHLRHNSNAKKPDNLPPPSGKRHSKLTSAHYDTPRSNSTVVNETAAQNAAKTEADDHAYEDVTAKEDQAPPLEHKTIPPDSEGVEAK